MLQITILRAKIEAWPHCFTLQSTLIEESCRIIPWDETEKTQGTSTLVAEPQKRDGLTE